MKSIQLIGVDKLDRMLSHLERQVFPQAAARALNTTATTVRSRSVRTIAKRMGVKQKVVRDRSRIRKARADRIDVGAEVTFTGRSLNLIRFKARQTKKGVSAAPGGKRKVFPQTFIVNLGTGEFVGVRRRMGRNQSSEPAATLTRAPRVWRIPVVGVVGPGVATTAVEPDIARERAGIVAEVLPARLRRELEYYVSRISG